MVDKTHARTRRAVLRGLGATGIAALAGCSGGDGGDGGDGGATDSGGGSTDTEGSGGTATSGDGGSGMDSVKAAWVYNSEVGDLGWSWAHNEGRKAVAEQFDWLETEYTEAVAPGDSQRVFEQYAQGDADIIFGCTFGYQDPMLNVAEQYTDTYFEHNTGYRTRENMGRYMGRIYQARYLAGQAAGMVTETDLLGYVAAFPIPEVIRGINAFTLGAASVNDAVTTKVRWTNSWFDPPTESEAAKALLDENVDVMAQHQDSPAALRAAADAGVWATGYDAPMGDIAGDNYLTSPIWHWEEFYGPTIQSVKDGSWEADAYWEGLDAGICSLDDWGPEVPQNVVDSVAESRSAIVGGDLDVWADSQFAGESDEFLFQEMGSYVENVEGEVPS
ncbi:BMP family ABC transporter substrate-binding protein [Haloarcula salina]|uniref:BMP family ABC transporter substrate-binding protein n=1 Tax=Haloarcula salina TaxID=1429914 RepID=A0AA41G200_9EURY|nr:BMP family ABC transporter substrate-binding protein [Haloarcula salina]MBV0902781.1 BMP family ABC transporter substrate-binding protein [Haloarcula salina]